MKQDLVPLAGGELNRAAHLRAKADVMRGQVDALVMPIWRGHVPTDAEGALALRGADAFVSAEAQELFLGLLPSGQPVFARDVSAFEPLATEADAVQPSPWSSASVVFKELDGLTFQDLRAVMTTLTPLEAEMAGTARGLFEWHRSHGFCAACGTKTEMSQGGWQRECSACGTSHFPRTDPVVIMLVTRGNSVLLGRNANWPERMYSLLAGFVEPGEPIEAAVRREVFEEAGVRVGKVSYVTSQPWPFPASLMLGCRAQAESTEIIVDPVEIEDARWVRREELAQAMAGQHPEIAPARKGAIAQVLMAKWLADDWE
ncbi:NAD(+) diphosphatase [Celeribacter sp. HF31]|uniref:NAD(+) diphosphatase n=1 Tax=Celeribacter sp. HF31 TaxID=2721558 RepID=UPI0014309161|nr:NAD(+) diphosphatase [Celeribacter sp. HF31]NIY80848.1 NAD(+) diphosphatase [Celeribacter sp. HF31]